MDLIIPDLILHSILVYNVHYLVALLPPSPLAHIRRRTAVREEYALDCLAVYT